MESARKTRRFRMWATVVCVALIGVSTVALISYQTITEIRKKLADREAVCPLVPEAQKDCVKFLASLRGKITAQGQPCLLIRKVGMKSGGIPAKTSFDVSCTGVDARTRHRYEIEDGVDRPLIRVIP